MSGVQLNSQQSEAVKYGAGPLLIIAGAGTGKTTVITERIKHLILNGFAKPQEVLALTFTEKAAREMQERVDVAMPMGYTQMWISTFHSFCDRVLRDDGLQIGLDTRYKLLTEAESVRFLRDNLFEFNLKYFRPLGNPNKFVGALLQHFSRLGDEDVSPQDYLEWAKKHKTKSIEHKKEELENEKWLELANAYQKYSELKIEKSYLDFADLITYTLKLFRERPNVLRQYQEKFKYLLVDEFQDTNIAQNELVKLLVNSGQNITVVADDDQAVYRWRGAATSNVIQFRETYPKTRIIALTQNYRSTQAILDASYKVIQNNNPDRLEVVEKISKKLISDHKTNGVAPELIYTDRVENEAEEVARKIVELAKEEDFNFSNFAVLVRANNHADPFVRAFQRANIPHQFLGPAKLFQQPEVKELISYLKVLYNLENWSAFYQVATMDIFQMSELLISRLIANAKKQNLTLFEVAKESKEKALKKLVYLIEKDLKRISKVSAGQILYDFLLETGVLRQISKPQTSEQETKALNIFSLLEKVRTYEVDHEYTSVFSVVDWIDLQTEVGESPRATNIDWQEENAVNILTIHSAKGLEFPVVFVVNLSSGRFPTLERREPIPIPDELIKEVLPKGDYHLQEERRLFYVAATRAKERLFITAADYYGEGKREKKLSPFVFEMFGNPQKTVRESEQLSILGHREVVGDYTKPKTQNLQAITYLSHSQIETFKFCPLHYKLRYILKIPTPPTASLSFGSTLHRVMQEFSLMLIQALPVGRQGVALSRPENILIGLLEKHWIPVGYESKKHQEMMKKRGEEYLKNYLKSDLYRPDSPPKLLEQKFIFPIEKNLKIGGVIDRVDANKNGIEIIDYKTTDFLSKDIPGEKVLKKDLQLSIYAMAANKINESPLGKSLDEITLSLYYFDLGIKVSTTRTQEELESAREEILRVKEEIEKSDFSCNKNYFCKDCEYSMFCETNI